MTILFETRRSLRRAGIALAAGASLFAMAGAAFAVPTLEVASVSGVWKSVTPNNATNLTGLNSNEIRWGNPNNDQNPNRIKSGYRFDGDYPQTGLVGEVPFELGTFTHYNYPITGTSISQAVLEVTFDFSYSYTDENNVTRTGSLTDFAVQYNFTHNETPNGSRDRQGRWDDPRTCANGGPNGAGVNVNGCADQVRVSFNENINTAIEVAEGVFYYLTVYGFSTGPDFWTVENRTNTATLMGVFSAEMNPVVPPIPLPAAAWMLIGGLGALGAVARRRKTADA